jgi:predicted HicB family RNase H-like nuclease
VPKKPPPASIPSHPRINVRISPAEKQAFTEAAARDNKSLGTWLKWLARQRIAEQNSD